jgi:hypothetical protein
VRRHALHLLAALLLLLAGAPAGLAGAEDCEGVACAARLTPHLALSACRSRHRVPGLPPHRSRLLPPAGHPRPEPLRAPAGVRLLIHRFNE